MFGDYSRFLCKNKCHHPLIYMGKDTLLCAKCKQFDSLEEREAALFTDSQIECPDLRKHGKKSCYYKKHFYLERVITDFAKSKEIEFDKAEVQMICSIFNDLNAKIQFLEKQPDYKNKKNVFNYKLWTKLIANKMNYTIISETIPVSTNKKKVDKYTRWFNLLWTHVYNE